MCEVIVLYEGYSVMTGKDQMSANCSCTLIKGVNNIIIDTMTSWDGRKILTALAKNNVNPENINYVICTHGHSDHIGNNNLFLFAKHIVGFSVSYNDEYHMHPFDKGEELRIDDNVRVIPTPGHTLSDVTVLVKAVGGATIAIVGDLFEKFDDIQNPNLWMEAGSEDPVRQMRNRSKVANLADWIVPGHGPQFQVTDQIRQTLRKQIGPSH